MNSPWCSRAVMRVEHDGGVTDVCRLARRSSREKGEWVRYSTPQGAEYVAICVPAFSPLKTVHRDA